MKAKKKGKGKYDLLVLETCLVESDISTWVIDSRTTNHVCFSLWSLHKSRELANEEYTMVVGTGARVSAKTMGEAKLQFATNKFLILRYVYFILGFRRNLIYVSKLNEQLFNVSFDNEIVYISNNGLNICYGYLDDELYFIIPTSKPFLNTEMFKMVEPKSRKQKIYHKDDTYLWHLRLGHININKIERLIKDEGPLRERKVGKLLV